MSYLQTIDHTYAYCLQMKDVPKLGGQGSLFGYTPRLSLASTPASSHPSYPSSGSGQTQSQPTASQPTAKVRMHLFLTDILLISCVL